MLFKPRGIAAVFLAAVLFSLTGCSAQSTPDILPHLPGPDADPVRPIAEREEYLFSKVDGELSNSEYRARIDELYSVVVYDKKQPVFADENDPVKPVYDSALNVLDGIVLNSWHTDAGGEYNVVHAVHDYLVCRIEYDFDLYERYSDGEQNLSGDPAFHIDGALINGVAVCDGISLTFAFLCAVEGVECIRVTGTLASVPHAWNKVRVDGVWYNVDVTADAADYLLGGKSYKQLSHGYFLVSDKTLTEFAAQPHLFADQPYVAEVDYDYYGDKTVEIDGKVFPLEITSQTELDALFAAVKRAGNIGKLEIKMSYPDRVQVNLADMYKSDIMSAYSVFGNTVFLAGGNTPYFRYPNGVYLILISK